MIKKSLIAILIIGVSVAVFLLIKPFLTADPYNVDKYIDSSLQDTLMANIVTYMGVKPRYADYMTRHEEQYRKFYVEQSGNYSFTQYYVNENNDHYFYIIRPARHAVGNRRATGGKMKVDQNMLISEYEEIFVTRVLDEDTLKSIAPLLFVSMIEGTIDEHIKSRKYIEWPDDRLKYHPVNKEWRYDVVENQ